MLRTRRSLADQSLIVQVLGEKVQFSPIRRLCGYCWIGMRWYDYDPSGQKELFYSSHTRRPFHLNQRLSESRAPLFWLVCFIICSYFQFVFPTCVLVYLYSETTFPSQSAAFREPRATVWIQPFSSQCPGAGARLDMLRVRRVGIMQLFQSPGHGVGWQSPGC